jgi:hypothetical protein
MNRPLQHAPDGWHAPRFLEPVLNFGSFPFSSLFLLSRTPQGHSASGWAVSCQVSKLRGVVENISRSRVMLG